eukprot:PLAT1448.1.p1 GENE.PLAT1448.1~~PLAT1448.1.p1  ORF type:complete len:594 (+),score=288.87 PLAT1448.1:558-2339(+)
MLVRLLLEEAGDGIAVVMEEPKPRSLWLACCLPSGILSLPMLQAFAASEACRDAVNLSGSTCGTPLLIAAAAGSLPAVKLLLDCGATLAVPPPPHPSSSDFCCSIVDLHGLTALHAAAMHAHTDVLRLLLQQAGAPAAVNGGHVSPLLLAARHPAGAGCVQLLLAAGADVHARARQHVRASRGFNLPLLYAPFAIALSATPLLCAARAGCDASVAALLDAGGAADVHTLLDGRCLLFHAALHCSAENVARLLAGGATAGRCEDRVAASADEGSFFSSPDAAAVGPASVLHERGSTPFLAAAARPNAAIMQLLMDAGQCGSERAGRRLPSPLMWAACKGDVEACRLLLEAGADASFVASEVGVMGESGPTSVAAAAAAFAPVLHLLFSTGALEKQVMFEGRRYAMMRGATCIQSLMVVEEQLRLVDKCMLVAMMKHCISSAACYLPLAVLLDCHGEPPPFFLMQVAVRNGNATALAQLIAAGGDISIGNYNIVGEALRRRDDAVIAVCLAQQPPVGDLLVRTVYGPAVSLMTEACRYFEQGELSADTMTRLIHCGADWRQLFDMYDVGKGMALLAVMAGPPCAAWQRFLHNSKQ